MQNFPPHCNFQVDSDSDDKPAGSPRARRAGLPVRRRRGAGPGPGGGRLGVMIPADYQLIDDQQLYLMMICTINDISPSHSRSVSEKSESGSILLGAESAACPQSQSRRWLPAAMVDGIRILHFFLSAVLLLPCILDILRIEASDSHFSKISNLQGLGQFPSMHSGG
jgi:hypothetical protein